MAKRRANGEGNIRKRKDGRWEGRYTAGTSPETGKQIFKNVLGKTQAEVKEKLKKALADSQKLDLAKQGNLRLEALRKAYQTLSDDERKLLCLYYYHEYSMEQIGREFGVTKMAISKRLRKILDPLRSLMNHEAPQIFLQNFIEIWFTNLLRVFY